MKQYLVTGAIEEAIERTKILLWPPQSGIWIRIAVIALFLVGGIINPLRSDSVPLSELPNLDLTGAPFPSAYMDLLLMVCVGILVAGLVYVILSAVFQFIFVDCLATNTILLTRTFRLRWKKGMHLVGFYLVLFAIIILCIIGLTFLLILPAYAAGILDLLNMMLLLIETLLLLLIILIPVWIIAILTADFVVPIMMVVDCGIIAGWRRTYHLFTGRWKVAALYTGLKIVIIFITGLVLGVIIFLISIPLGIIGTILSIQTGSPLEDSAGAVGFMLGTGALFLLSLLLLVPVITFFRYYSLVVLRDLDPGYDLLPKQSDQ